MQRIPWDWLAGSACSFLSPSSTPTSPPVPKARGILQRKHLLKLSQLSSLCVSYLLNADASSSVIPLAASHRQIRLSARRQALLGTEPAGRNRRATGRGGSVGHAHTRPRRPELTTPTLGSGGPELVASLGFPGGSNSKESACNAGALDSIPGGRSPGGRNGNSPQYPCLENPVDQGARGRGREGAGRPRASCRQACGRSGHSIQFHPNHVVPNPLSS